MLQLISALTSTYSLVFCTAAAKSSFAVDLNEYEVDTKIVEINSSKFDRFVKELDPAVVIFDRFLTEEQYGWRVAAHCPNAVRILDLEDLHCLRRVRQKALKESRKFNVVDLLEDDVAKREVASIFRSDLTLVISEFEMRLLNETFSVPEKLLFYLPILAEVQRFDVPTFGDRRNFVFIGNFLHEPNTDAVNYLKTAIWPKLGRDLPKSEMHVYGAYPTGAILKLNNPKEKFFVHGRADNAREVVRNARVVLAPLRFGAGLKGKLIEAMECGTPSVTTSIGAEGIGGDMTWSGFVTDDADLFIEKATQLYSDEALWTEARQCGFEILGKRFAKSEFESKLRKKVSMMATDLVERRKENFIGAMLRFHTARSTEFFSRWIEEKNKSR